ncbi:nuclear hormone receptor family member nhr-69-like [Ischnura elegans]|uniref:nuclear hormone receptor family member nhr-69-like n=1 Tax=Ischnura elegans TaxID=197161 RepID=UPI001ED88127|nr:nuclear hormone receptor family member nhr-69-like [Ischnura elegans]
MVRPRGSKCGVCTQRCFPRKCNPKVCPSCNLFGWRSIRPDKVYVCRFRNSCNIAENRRRCQACRLRKVAACWEEFNTKKISPRYSRLTQYRRTRISKKVMQLRMAIAAMDAAMLHESLVPEDTAAEERNERLLHSQNAASAVGQDDQRMMQAIVEETIEENLGEEMLGGTDEPGIRNETSTGSHMSTTFGPSPQS